MSASSEAGSVGFSLIRRVAMLLVVASTVAWLAPLPEPARAAPAGVGSPATANLTVSRDTVAILLLPSIQLDQGPEAAKTFALARAAIARVKPCLGGNDAEYALVFAHRVVVRSVDHVDAFNVGELSPSVAALLARPGLHTRVIYATGPESLEQMLPFAVQQYFKRRC
jgi:hypothetical protein